MPHAGLAGADLLSAALAALANEGLTPLAMSSMASTAPVGPIAQPDFTNAAALIATQKRDPVGVYQILQRVEAAFGRVRRERWGPRTLDLDLIDAAGAILVSQTLTLPHPRAQQRRFVLEPLAEIAPGWLHPISGKTAAQLLARLDAQP
jgi:2-amino-4-hydroxy-6-hydroxymethyldihydropteridine diphosphokinase